ncbi:hypothetical protein AWT69_000701 [Pseudomonas putida]|nr:hypothetical protein AWT69_000701 [Pseudomonas putida]
MIAELAEIGAAARPIATQGRSTGGASLCRGGLVSRWAAKQRHQAGVRA